MARRGGNRIFGIVIVVLLAGGLVGFGTQVGLSGRNAAIGTVGGLPVTAQEYANRAANEAGAAAERIGRPLAPEERTDLDRQVLAQLVTERTLDAEAERLGLSVGDARVAAAVRANPAFQGLAGDFDRTTYRDQLQRIGITESDYEESLRRDSARTLLQATILGGLPEPTVAADALAAWQAESRIVTWAELPGETVAPSIPDRTAEELRAWYDAHPEAYTSPEVRRVAYAWATPETLAPGIEVDEAAVRALYDSRPEEYRQEERRLVERLALEDEATAEAARERLDSGEIGFDGLVAERGLSLSDIDLGDVARGDLGDAAEAVFAASPGEVVGPTPSDFGPALFRVNAVLAASEIPFEEAAEGLRAEIAADRAREAIDDVLTEVEDLAAGGATVADVAERTLLEPGTLDWSEGVSEGPAAYAGVRAAIQAAEPGDLPEIVRLEDGGLAVIAVEEVVPPALRPFEEVEAQVRDDAAEDAIRAATLAEAEARAEAIAGGASFEDQGLAPRTEGPRTRRDVIEGAPPGTVEAAFGLAPGEALARPSPGGAVVIRLDEVVAAPADDPLLVAARESLAGQLSESMAQDVFAAFASRLQSQTEVRMDDAAVQAVNGQIR